MNYKLSLTLGLLGVFMLSNVGAAEGIFNCKKKKNKAKTEQKEKPTKSPYQTFIEGNQGTHGLFSVYLTNDKKCNLEIPAAVLGKPMIFSSKISESSNSKCAMAGTMMETKLVTFTRDDEFLTLRYIVSQTETRPGQTEIAEAIKRNNITPAAAQFKIVHKSPKDSSFVIDVTDFMKSTEGDMGIQLNFFSAMMQAPKISPNPQLNTVLSAKSFERNLNIKVRLSYKSADEPFEATVTRSFVLLPETPMKGRIAEDRMNYFRTDRYVYDMNEDRGRSFSYINRWNLQPRAEDLEKYRRGELVEPEKPIVYYLDNAFPAKWRSYLKAGIEDWQKAFETIGFKNAIVAKDFPADDPNFDPDDIRYSCVRYITVPIANAMGPSWVDPRSGEIIQGSVYFYHNVIQLVHNWMFAQTAACNPAVRKKVFDDQTMGRSLRYIVAHEIGHTLGLMHNMKASAAYPTDSLRSATFTQKYGTTSSIMDYARFNFVAQPGDKGVSFLPPYVGEYDKFAIKVGYQPIFEEDEKATLKKWFDQVKGKEMYVYGPQAMGLPSDPSAQSEDLGDDPVKSSTYGIKNLKYIMSNLMQWSKEDNFDISDMNELYKAVLSQFNLHFGHVCALIGGTYLYMPELNDAQAKVVPVSKQRQKEALAFLMQQIYDMPTWTRPQPIVEKLGRMTDFSDIQSKMLSQVLSLTLRIDQNATQSSGYSSADYLNDVFQSIWGASRKNDRSQRALEYEYVKQIMGLLGYGTSAGRSGTGLSAITEFDAGCGDRQVEISSITNANEPYSTVIYRGVLLDQLTRIRSIAAGRVGTGSAEARAHYKYLIHEIDKALKK